MTENSAFLTRYLAREVEEARARSLSQPAPGHAPLPELLALGRAAGRPDLQPRELGAWVSQFGSRAAAEHLRRAPGREEHQPRGKLTGAVAAAAADMQGCSLLHGYDRGGRMVHFDRTSRLPMRLLEARHTVADAVTFKHLEFSYYVQVARELAWLRWALAGERGAAARRAAALPGDWAVEAQRLPGGQVRRRRVPADPGARAAAEDFGRGLPDFANQMLSVVDMEGADSAHVGAYAREFVAEMARMAEGRMPSGPALVVIVNAPWAVRAAFKISRASFGRGEIEIHAGPARERLLELIAPDQLPPEYGGTCACCPAGCLSPDAPDQRAKTSWMEGWGTENPILDYLRTLGKG